MEILQLASWASNNRLLIHDSEVDGVVTCDESGVIKLQRHVTTLCLESILVIHIDNKAGGVPGEITTDFTPFRTGTDQAKFLCGAGKFQFSVVWSLMDSGAW